MFTFHDQFQKKTALEIAGDTWRGLQLPGQHVSLQGFVSPQGPQTHGQVCLAIWLGTAKCKTILKKPT